MPLLAWLLVTYRWYFTHVAPMKPAWDERHLQGNYPAMLDYYTGDLRALARGMLSTTPINRPSADEVCTSKYVCRCLINNSCPSNFKIQAGLTLFFR